MTTNSRPIATDAQIEEPAIPWAARLRCALLRAAISTAPTARVRSDPWSCAGSEC